MQEVSITASPLLALKKEEKKLRKAQELLHRIHTHKQRVGITFLYMSETLSYLPAGNICKTEVKTPGYQNVLLLLSPPPNSRKVEEQGKKYLV